MRPRLPSPPAVVAAAIAVGIVMAASAIDRAAVAATPGVRLDCVVQDASGLVRCSDGQVYAPLRGQPGYQPQTQPPVQPGGQTYYPPQQGWTPGQGYTQPAPGVVIIQPQPYQPRQPEPATASERATFDRVLEDLAWQAKRKCARSSSATGADGPLCERREVEQQVRSTGDRRLRQYYDTEWSRR